MRVYLHGRSSRCNRSSQVVLLALLREGRGGGCNWRRGEGGEGGGRGAVYLHGRSSRCNRYNNGGRTPPPRFKEDFEEGCGGGWGGGDGVRYR